MWPKSICKCAAIYIAFSTICTQLCTVGWQILCKDFNKFLAESLCCWIWQSVHRAPLGPCGCDCWGWLWVWISAPAVLLYCIIWLYSSGNETSETKYLEKASKRNDRKKVIKTLSSCYHFTIKRGVREEEHLGSHSVSHVCIPRPFLQGNNYSAWKFNQTANV